MAESTDKIKTLHPEKIKEAERTGSSTVVQGDGKMLLITKIKDKELSFELYKNSTISAENSIGMITLNNGMLNAFSSISKESNTAISVDRDNNGNIVDIRGGRFNIKTGELIEEITYTEELKKILDAYSKIYENQFGNEIARIETEVRLAAVPSLTSSAIMEKLGESGSTPRVFEENRAKIRENEERLKSAAALEKSVRDEMEKVLRELELEKLLLNDRNFLSVREERGKTKAREDEKRLADLINDGFNALVVPKLIERNVASREDRLLIKDALKDGKLVIKEGEITIMRGYKGPTAAVKSLQRQVGSAWNTLEKSAKAEVFAVAEARTHEEKAKVIESNVALDLTKAQRESISREMARFMKTERNDITESLQSGNADRLMKAVNKAGDEKVFDKLYGIMLKVGTEKMNEQVTEKMAVLEERFSSGQIATMVERKAKEMKIELSEEDKAVVSQIREDGLRQHRERALTQLSGILFEVMGDSNIVGKSERTNLPKAG